jgi:hypothetical protein
VIEGIVGTKLADRFLGERWPTIAAINKCIAGQATYTVGGSIYRGNCFGAPR